MSIGTDGKSTKTYEACRTANWGSQLQKTGTAGSLMHFRSLITSFMIMFNSLYLFVPFQAIGDVSIDMVLFRLAISLPSVTDA